MAIKKEIKKVREKKPEKRKVTPVNKRRKTERITIEETIKKLTDDIKNSELVKLNYAIEKKSEQLLLSLQSRNFDVVEELLNLYTLGRLTDKERMNLLLELMPYIYPKLKILDNIGDKSTVSTNNIQVQVLYTNQKLDDGENAKPPTQELDLGY